MKKLLFMTIFMTLFTITNAQNERFKALFLYNFTKYIEWPKEFRKGDFVIGILGSSKVTERLETIAKRKTAGSQKIIVTEYSSLEEIKNCHILYLAPSKSREFYKVLKKFESNTLIVTDKVGLGKKGAGINYILDDGNLVFEISKKNINKRGLKVLQALIGLGKEI